MSFDEINNQLKTALQSIGGCGSSLCIIDKPTGIAVNGPCRCNEDKMRMARTVSVYRQFHKRSNELKKIIDKNFYTILHNLNESIMVIEAFAIILDEIGGFDETKKVIEEFAEEQRRINNLTVTPKVH